MAFLGTRVVDKIVLKFLVCICCFCRLASQEKTVDWCKLKCRDGSKNTMCKYGPKTNAGDCKNIKMVTTPIIRKEFLDLHNAYRNRMAAGEIESKGEKWPIAGDMRQMSWDGDLEKLAWRWGQQCSTKPPHDKCRRTPAFEYNGQNKGWAISSAEYPSPNGSFTGWTSEISDTGPALIDSFKGGKWGHFSQVIWANSYKLGCSVIHAEEKGMKATTVICNYGPGGNVESEKIYAKGTTPCDSCQSGTSCREDSAYPHLCALPSDDKQPQDVAEPPDINGSNRLTMPREIQKGLQFPSVALLSVFISLVNQISG